MSPPDRSPAHAPVNPSRASGCSLQDEFFGRAAAGKQLSDIFEHLPGVYFFLKDEQGRMVSFNRSLLGRFGIEDNHAIVGASDYDLFPRKQADRFVEDDQRVFRSGQPLVNVVEQWRDEQPILTNKFPIHDENGTIIGLMGAFQLHVPAHAPPVDVDLEVVTQFIRGNLGRPISVDQLADQAMLSVRQLRRRFHQAFGTSIQEYILKMRVEAASEALLHTDAPIAEIAVQYGFCDQSAFTHRFRRQTGMTPRCFRQRGEPRESPGSQ